MSDTAMVPRKSRGTRRPGRWLIPELAEQLLARAREQGVSLLGPDGLLKQLTKTVLETALNEELTEHLGHDKHGLAGHGYRERAQWHQGQDGADRGHGGGYRGPAGPGRDLRAADRPEGPAAAVWCG